MMKHIALAWIIAWPSFARATLPDDTGKVGPRPYEMEWAGRTEDQIAPLIDFENLDGWSVQGGDVESQFGHSREQQLWGKYVGRLAYAGNGKPGQVLIRPPQPLSVPAGADCISLWMYGNRLGWAEPGATPLKQVFIRFASSAGKEISVNLGSINWEEWHLLHVKLSPEQLAAMGSGARFVGIGVSGTFDPRSERLYFDNLAIYHEELKSLSFPPQPRRNVDLWPGQSPGLNTSPVTLPFPTRPQTILPANLTRRFSNELVQDGDTFVFTYRGEDGELSYRYQPHSGDLSDITVHTGNFAFLPLEGGGANLASDDSRVAQTAQKKEIRREGDTVVAHWRVTRGPSSAEVRYVLRLWQKSLVVDVLAPGGQVGEVAFGRAGGVGDARQIPIPFLNFRRAERPLTLLIPRMGNTPLFLSGHVDWYRSNASELFMADQWGQDWAQYNGGARYLPRTDGRRNDCFERLFVTVSPRFEETLPTIDNPISPWRAETAMRVWRAHGASNRQRDYETWARWARLGMTKLLITDHETGWRDGCESFTFRTRTAPGRGGDESQKEYARRMQALGLRYGIYNNYTDFAPVNEFWHPDMVCRRPDGNWTGAWYRCYSPKPARAVEYEAKLAPIIQEKFNLSTAYCDVHTAIAPWQRTDYDARVPGAGTFAATYYPYGQIMLHQKKTWNGPVYSEGGSHWIYVGLTDGDYGQDEPAQLPTSPWLVDFDLLKMHPLATSFGMGNPEMFYGHRTRPLNEPATRDARLDLFLTATVAFGHTGFFVTEAGQNGAMRSYYMVQAMSRQYGAVNVAEIRYADAKGELFATSEALANEAYRMRRIRTRYENGYVTLVNGSDKRWVHHEENQTLEIPPSGYVGLIADHGRLKPHVSSTMMDGRRVDAVRDAQYRYYDGRGSVARLADAACDGPLVVLQRPEGLELIPGTNVRVMAVAADGATAVALDQDRKELGPAEVKVSRGLAHVTPVKGAISYLLKPGEKPAATLRCDRAAVIPGDQVTVRGTREHTIEIPLTSTPGEHLWRQAEGAWIDFDVVEPVRHTLTADGDTLRLTLTSQASRPADVQVQTGAAIARSLRLEAGKATTIQLDPQLFAASGQVTLLVSTGQYQQKASYKLEKEHRPTRLLDFGQRLMFGQTMRGGPDQAITPDSGAGAYPDAMKCGGVLHKGIFMHPPYKRGVGQTWAKTRAITLPAQAAALRCLIGKRDGSARGDGISFQLVVIDRAGHRTIVAQRQWAEHQWTTLEADLSKWAGQSVMFQFIADVGPKNDSSGDWACWSDLRVESLLSIPQISAEPVK